jgi:choline dehydrogenase-like flavoprotein
MGAVNDVMAVVDPELKIRGMTNARVIDASVFPVMVTANPMMTVLIVAEKAADMILGDYAKRSKAAKL